MPAGIVLRNLIKYPHRTIIVYYSLLQLFINNLSIQWLISADIAATDTSKPLTYLLFLFKYQSSILMRLFVYNVLLTAYI